VAKVEMLTIAPDFWRCITGVTRRVGRATLRK
jgi:hypothetical protein